ncbi:TonB-dependent receptor [Parapedobacter sp. ISTM3]|uniref:SusC/RagA family TonB-linked outer membrane protein n=1 Tax=Parapedobacter sp. ISTM3 TaxID=2800130 RepID=UPI0019040589|nr:TonB-dependent receptor [Parapedobacter sp. ISTM3]MBK1440964.1 TonB-dependent receptor [Parapedobacter sp. ISTM3]
MKQKLLLLLALTPMLTVALWLPLSAQSGQIEVSGTVTDAEGPVAGVSVTLKGAPSVGTKTDENGAYSLSVPENGTLVFSYVGYVTAEEPLAGRRLISVTLATDDNQMDEVVVVAFGQQKKVSLTGAISTVGTRELRQSPVANLSNALAGRLPGLITFQPSGEPGRDLSNLYIRGVSTFSNAGPLVVVDGVLGRDFAQLDPNEVESISILKDASATAVYGVRGANGVILVTTRRGVASDRPTISFSSELGYQSPTRLPDYLSSYDYARLYNEALANDFLPPKYSEQDLEYYRIGADPYLYPNTDWFDVFMRDFTPMSRANLNINGGGDRVRYFVSASALFQNGMYNFNDLNEYNTNAKFNRYNFRSNIDIDLNKNFSVGLDLAGRVENRNYPGKDTWHIFEILNRIPPSYPIYNADGSLAGDGLNPDNPMGMIAHSGYRNLYGNFLQGTYRMAHKLDFITEGLSARGAFAFDGAFDYNINASKDYAVYQLREDGGYNQFRNDTELGIGKGYAYDRTVNLEFALDYSRTFGEHQVTGLFLYNLNRRVEHDDAYNIPFGYLGYVGRITYAYKNTYFGEVNMGYNGSEQFPKGQRFGFFPSLSMGWVVSNENFMEGQDRFISFLKLRGSYGEVGNDRFGSRRFLYQQTYGGSSGYRFGLNQAGYDGFGEGQLANHDITWERAKKANVGIELGLAQDRIFLTADVFQERREDILTTRGTISEILGRSGGDLPPVNIGVVRNRGLDMELTYRTRATDTWNFSVSGNLTFARNKILFMDEEPRQYDYQYRTGKPVGQPFGWVAIGFFQSQEDIDNSPRQTFVSQESLRPGDIKYQDINNDGVIDANDQVAIGYNGGVPELMFGLSSRISYKSLDFSFLFQGAGRSSVFLDNFPVWEFRGGNGKAVRWHLDRWTPETAETATYPRLFVGDNSNNHRFGTFWMRKRDYLRLKNVELGYTLASNFIKDLRIQNIRLYANAYNLFTWDQAKITDPELPSWSGNNDYPQQRVINFGITANF